MHLHSEDRRNPGAHGAWANLFSTAHLHHPSALAAELEAAGFACESILGIHGPGWMVPDFAECWSDPIRREVILQIARMTETEPVLSPHMIAVAR